MPFPQAKYFTYFRRLEGCVSCHHKVSNIHIRRQICFKLAINVYKHICTNVYIYIYKYVYQYVCSLCIVWSVRMFDNLYTVYMFDTLSNNIKFIKCSTTFRQSNFINSIISKSPACSRFSSSTNSELEPTTRHLHWGVHSAFKIFL